MKTTIELPDGLAHEARELARDQGVTLRELVVEGLRHEVTRRSMTSGPDRFEMPTFEGDGLQPGVTWENLISYAYEDPA